MGITTAAEVCNLGLTAIGHTAYIDALDEESTEAEVANATRRAALAMLAGPGVNEARLRNGWAYTYATPVDLIAAQHITVDGIRAPAPEARIPFKIEADNGGHGPTVAGKVVLTDQDAAELVYTARVTTPALWSGAFVEALSWKLAAKFALGIQKKPAVALQMEQAFERALAIAAASQYRQSTEDRPPDSEFITARR